MRYIQLRGGLLFTQEEYRGVKNLLDEDDASHALWRASTKKCCTSRRDDSRWIEELSE